MAERGSLVPYWLRPSLWPIGAFVCGVALASYYPAGWVFHDVLVLVGHTLAAGGATAAVFELAFAKKLVSDTADRLAERLVGIGLPAELQAVIGEIVHRTTFVHRHSSIRYTIKADPENKERAIVTVCREYEVWNYGRGPLQYEAAYAEERIHRPKLLSVSVFKASTKLDCTDGISQDGATDGSAIEFKVKPVTLEPVASSSDYVPLKVRWMVEAVTPRSYTDVISFGMPTIDFEISVDAAPGFCFTASDEPGCGGQYPVWRYKGAHLPGQHLRVWWEPEGSADAR
jgi:hypothetical protein